METKADRDKNLAHLDWIRKGKILDYLKEIENKCRMINGQRKQFLRLKFDDNTSSSMDLMMAHIIKVAKMVENEIEREKWEYGDRGKLISGTESKKFRKKHRNGR